ncbi:DUF2621 family protein [Paenibacillus aquistagni]|uniref:DUF2621 domain-containing protein n=1 Tax=Paenibacillus aquistagni TaxID=1852522 RepID=A0A1X7K3L9_9BACL|nr:DUF2621 family protein [Paenibacillus aquistagni]NMM53986.1 DUF2621 family protein [Paenibacillus aquistagni]SMG35324.1 Protein of unknown function [Paenibacillus aquistagni]
MIHYSLLPLNTSGPPNWFMNSIAFWGLIMLGFMSIGGFFMFRKFLKVLPMRDGKSKLDWQNYWVEKSRSLWTEESKELLQLLVQPVPKAFRDIAAHSIAARIGQIAVESGASQVTKDHVIEGYIKATPKRDHSYLEKTLKRHEIDYARFKHLLQ